ncbi:MAG: phosphatase PAP2 family protein [Planctomycetota bacterium]|nr:phosphatase PAP2 family protein [Planctomycetota bacterium]
MIRWPIFFIAVNFLCFWSAGCAFFRSAQPQHSQANTKLALSGSHLVQHIAYQAEQPPASLDENQPYTSASQKHDMVTIDDQSLASLGALDDLAKELRPVMTEKQLPLMERLAKDQWRFYSKENAIPMALVFGTGAVVANTQLDNQLQRHFRSSVLGASTDEWFEKLHASKELGNGRYTLPVFGVAWLAKECLDGPPVLESFGTWGERSMRGFLVGAGPVIAGQYLTGGSRPSELEKTSYWHPLQDNNGVSGHAFMSALPFITAAKMTDNPFAKLAFYSGSTIGPLSRMNDNAHYPSQIGIGWCIAYLSATAIDHSDSKRPGWSLKPLTTNSGSGLAAEYIW